VETNCAIMAEPPAVRLVEMLTCTRHQQWLPGQLG
jgi:hypothetical protein